MLSCRYRDLLGISTVSLRTAVAKIGAPPNRAQMGIDAYHRAMGNLPLAGPQAIVYAGGAHRPQRDEGRSRPQQAASMMPYQIRRRLRAMMRDCGYTV
jgi:hypothetical protein